MVRRVVLLIALLAILLLAFLLPAEQEPLLSPDQANTAALGLLLLEENDGLYVLAVIENSIAARVDIEPGDILQSASGTLLTSVSELDGLLNTPSTEKRLHLTIMRDQKQLTRYLPLP